MNVTFSRNSRMLLEEDVERGEPAQHVLREVRPVDPQDQVLAPAAQDLGLVPGDALARGDLLEGLAVDRERVRAHPGLAAVGRDHGAAPEVGAQVHQLAAALEEVVAVRARVEADDVVREQALEDLAAHVRGQDAPCVGRGPGDVHEVMEERVRALSPDQGGRGVEVVVVDHHERLLGVLDRFERGSREVLVHALVAGVPRLSLDQAEVRHVREVPQVVLDEPQHRVRDHVVEAVVGLRVRCDQADAVGHAVHLDLEVAVAVRAARLDVLVGHRRRDPQRVAVSQQARERRDEAAAPAPRHEVARGIALERGRAAIGEQDQPALRVSHYDLKPGR